MNDYLNELQLPNRILLGPGPSNVHPRVLQAMLTPMLGHLDPDFWQVTDQIRAMLRLVFRTSQNWTLPLPATGTAGMESAFCNVVELCPMARAKLKNGDWVSVSARFNCKPIIII